MLVQYPSPVLKSQAKEVDRFDDDLRKLVVEMHACMILNGGIGLSGNQVGVLKRIIVINITGYTPITLINPEIYEESTTLNTLREGCLSFPGIFIDVQRPSKIRVRAKDEYGRNVDMLAEGLLATCIQHEVDHLNGVVFIDK